MSIYERKLKIRSCDVDMDRRLRLPELLTLIQESTIAHTEELGMGREKTLDRGLLWVLIMQRLEIERLPEYDEEVLYRSWPGRTMHLLFPRHFAMYDAEGKAIIRASAVWSLIDEKARSLVFPEKYGVVIEGENTGEEIPLPAPVRALPQTQKKIFRVPYSYIDLNGHMNNTRYAELMEDCLYEETKGLKLKSLRQEFLHEIRLGEELTVSWGNEGNTWFMTGTLDQPCFKMQMIYG